MSKDTSIGDLHGTARAEVSTLMSLVSDVQPIIEAATMTGIHDSLTTFFDSIPGVLRALDEVANIHPFIKGEYRLICDYRDRMLSSDRCLDVL